MLGFVEESPVLWLVMASLAGAARNPGWLYNLARRPEAVMEFGDGRRVQVRGETLEGDQLADAWQKFGEHAPEYVKYQSRTDRQIAMVRLNEIVQAPQTA